MGRTEQADVYLLIAVGNMTCPSVFILIGPRGNVGRRYVRRSLEKISNVITLLDRGLDSRQYKFHSIKMMYERTMVGPASILKMG
jgi:hypothetical protein